MANQLICIAILTLALLVIVALFEIALYAGRSQISMTVSTGTSEQEMIAGKHYREINDQVADIHSTLHEQTPPQDSAYNQRGTVGQTERENGRSIILPSRESTIERKILDTKREIPGGQDSQHHPKNDSGYNQRGTDSDSKRESPGGPNYPYSPPQD